MIALARRLGMQVEIIGRPTDCVVCIGGRLYWLEIKNPKVRGHKDEYTPAQHDFLERVAASGAPMLTWYTEDDVLACYEGEKGTISYREREG